MELEVAACHWADSRGQHRCFRYYLTVDVINAGRFCCENYGVRIAEDAGDSVAIPGITVSDVRIDELLTLLVEHQVGPAGLADVVADWV